MRISDWSSDVCSSDLSARKGPALTIVEIGDEDRFIDLHPIDPRLAQMTEDRRVKPQHLVEEVEGIGPLPLGEAQPGDGADDHRSCREALRPGLTPGVEHAQPAERQLLPGRQFGHDIMIIGVERSEEDTSELQSLMRISYAVFCLKKKTANNSKLI